ncbi:hypothetical protein SPAN111604_03070 [Sphingomonas antarctica]|uniref:O-antigen ligase family protein n=1 Tax=Sphingomonas antarctica TaxID=2040274 RepID=UPI0039EA1EEE
MIAAVKRRFFPVEPVLPGYRQPKNALWIRLRNFIFIGTLIFVGLFYGLMSAIFPVFLYMYMAMPLVIIAGAVIWALPNTDRFPERSIEAFFWIFLFAQLLWPNYIALALPGLPWITINRLVTAPLALLFLYSMSVAPRLRTQIRDVLINTPIVTRCFLGLLALQLFTLPASTEIADSFNKTIDQQIQWNLVFFVSCFVFTKDGRARKFFVLYPWLVIFLCAMSVFEWKQSAVLWADHIPAILAVGDESVQRVLQGTARAATGIYRVQSIFTTSLNFAEVMAWSTPFFVYWGLYAKRIPIRVASLLFLAPLFWCIRNTDSRLGAVGFFATFIVYFGIYGIRRWTRTRGDILGPAITLSFPLAGSMFFLATFVSNSFHAIIFGNGAQAASNEGRALQWASLWPKLGSWPFGYGTGRGAETIGSMNLAGVLTIDSYYINLLIEYGVIGFLCWLGIILGSAANAVKWSMRETSEEARMLTVMATYMIVYFIIKGVLAGDESNAICYMILGMIAGTAWRIKQRLEGHAPAIPA